MTMLQRVVRVGRTLIPRGWSPLLRLASRVLPRMQTYPAQLAHGDTLYIDLRESMCHTYFYFGGLPHERGTARLLRHVLRAGGTFVDVGANVGYFTRIASELVGPRGRVYAFDPLPNAVRLLRRNAADCSNVRVFAVALSDQPGSTTLFVRSNGDTSSLGSNGHGHVDEVTVPVTTLDRELEGIDRVDLVKIDVEGFEYEVLAGGESILSRHRPVLYFELLEEYVAVNGRDRAAFESLLGPMGYSLSWMQHDDGPLLGATRSNYLVAVPEERFQEIDGAHAE